MSATNKGRSNNTGVIESSFAKPVKQIAPKTGSSAALLNKEEEYLKLNAELEAKTATLVYEADQVLKENEKLLSEASILTRINNNDYLENIISNIKNDTRLKSSNTSLMKPKLISKSDTQEQHEIESIENTLGVVWNEADYINDDEDLTNRSNLLMPKQANEMSNDVQIRFLKAKLRVMQEETERLNSEMTRKDEEIAKLVQRCKDLDEDKQRNSRTINSNQTQIEKFKKQIDELSQKLSQSELQLQAIKKDYEASKKELKKQQQDEAQVEIRVNRLLEENEKYKQQLSKIQTQSKDVNEQDKKRVEQLQIDNKRLEKQKQELIQAFKKQLKLIDILKKQKMHLEASKMLQFSEEEFLKALEWNQTTSNTNYEPVQNSN